MKFRPCIDIHNGSVKQIVGGSLKDESIETGSSSAKENYVSRQDAGFYAKLYRDRGLSGGHIILLNQEGSPCYEQDVEQAKLAFDAYPQGLQIGGGINAENAMRFLRMGASKVIVTSYVFSGGKIQYDNLTRLRDAVGTEHLVLDLSCRKRNGRYYIVTDRWQNFTDVEVNEKTLAMLADFCSEYLIHAVDVEGTAQGIEEELAALLGSWGEIPMTYAGGVGSFSDLQKLKELGKDRLDVTVGSALDLFGGDMNFEQVLTFCENK